MLLAFKRKKIGKAPSEKTDLSSEIVKWKESVSNSLSHRQGSYPLCCLQWFHYRVTIFGVYKLLPKANNP
jgi:hypothetical protein